MIAKNPQYRIPLSNILVHKWVRFNQNMTASGKIKPSSSPSNQKDRLESEENLNIQLNNQGKNFSPSTRLTSTCKLSLSNSTSKPSAYENNGGGKLFNSVNSLCLVTVSSISQSSCMSNMSRDYSIESISKRSKFSNVSLNYISDKKPDPVISPNMTMIASLKNGQENKFFNENFILSDRELQMKIKMKILNESGVEPRFNVKFERGRSFLSGPKN